MPAPDPARASSSAPGAIPIGSTRDTNGAWASGVYLARLTARARGRQAVLHRLRRPRRCAAAAMLFQSSVTTSRPTTTGAASRCTPSTAATRRRGGSFDRPYPRTRTASASTAPAISSAAGVQRPPLPRARRLRRHLCDRVDTHQRPVARAAQRGISLGRPRRVLVVGDARARGGRARPGRAPRLPRRRRLLLADPLRAERPRRCRPHDRRLQGSRGRSRPARHRPDTAEQPR